MPELVSPVTTLPILFELGFKPANEQILQSLSWHAVPRLSLRDGCAYRIYSASVPSGHQFWDLWKVNRVPLEERGFRVRSAFPQGWRVELHIPAPEALEQLLAGSTATTSSLEVPAPAGLVYYDFQRAGVEFLDRQPAALLADDMGTGKTIQVAGLLNLRPEIRAVLIVCPPA